MRVEVVPSPQGDCFVFHIEPDDVQRFLIVGTLEAETGDRVVLDEGTGKALMELVVRVLAMASR